jgi:hypothetical protein
VISQFIIIFVKQWFFEMDENNKPR